MSKRADFENRDRLMQIGINIGTIRRIRGMSQEQLAAKAHISRSFLSIIEAPKTVRSFSLEVLFNISDALDVKPDVIINTSVIKNIF